MRLASRLLIASLSISTALMAQTSPNNTPTPATSAPALPSEATPVAVSRVPRVFLQSASKGNSRNAARDQSSEMAKDFEKDCPDVKITINQAKADYTVSLNHIEVGAFIRDNQFEVYDADGDRMKGKEGGSIRNGVKGVCSMISRDFAIKSASTSSTPVIAPPTK